MQICLKSYIPNAKYCHGCGKSVNLANSDTNKVSEKGTSTGGGPKKVAPYENRVFRL